MSSRPLAAWSVHRIYGLFQGNAYHQSYIERRGREECVSFAGGTGFKALAGDPPTDITIHDFFSQYKP